MSLRGLQQHACCLRGVWSLSEMGSSWRKLSVDGKSLKIMFMYGSTFCFCFLFILMWEVSVIYSHNSKQSLTVPLRLDILNYEPKWILFPAMYFGSMKVTHRGWSYVWWNIIELKLLNYTVWIKSEMYHLKYVLGGQIVIYVDREKKISYNSEFQEFKFVSYLYKWNNIVYAILYISLVLGLNYNFKRLSRNNCNIKH